MAAVGGMGSDFRRRCDGEAFDPEAQTWQALPPMAHGRIEHGVVAVPGGLLAIGGNMAPSQSDSPNELYDEESGRWFDLPHPMAEPRDSTVAVSLPAAALAPAAAAAGAAATAE